MQSTPESHRVRRSAWLASPLDDDDATVTEQPSPATQTLDHLSQSKDYSQLERTAIKLLASGVGKETMTKSNEGHKQGGATNKTAAKTTANGAPTATTKKKGATKPAASNNKKKKPGRKKTKKSDKRKENETLLMSPPVRCNGLKIFCCHIHEDGKLGGTLAKAVPSYSQRLIDLYNSGSSHSVHVDGHEDFVFLPTSDDHCVVVEFVQEGGRMAQAGIQPGDCLLLWRPGSKNHPSFVPHWEQSYSTFVNIVKRARRPITFCVLRDEQVVFTKLSQHDEHDDKSASYNVHSQGSTVTGRRGTAAKIPKSQVSPSKSNKRVHSASKTTAASSVQSTKKINKDSNTPKPPPAAAESTSTKEVFPFCSICNGRSPNNDKSSKTRAPVHHVWCPCSPQHVSSGAHEILARIRYGLARNCVQCRREWQRGCRSGKPGDHNRACRDEQKRLVEAAASDSDGSESIALLNLSPSGTQLELGCGDSDQSVYREPERKSFAVPSMTQKKTLSKSKKTTAHETRLNKESASSKQKARHATAKKIQANKSSNNKSSGRKSTTGAKAAKVTAKSSESAGSRPKSICTSVQKMGNGTQSENSDKRNVNVEAGQVADNRKNATNQSEYSDSEVEDTSDEKLLLEWTPHFEVPWGPSRILDDDVVVYSSTGDYEGNPEVALFSARYTAHPFGTPSSRYRNTHRGPEEGLEALVLQRDVQHRSHWGFSVYRHEFGGACLVESVAPFSPADQAVRTKEHDGTHHTDNSTMQTLLSCPTIGSKLRPNDMILAVNGKQVGGMMVSTFSVELETTGHELIVLVSRYKTNDEDTLQQVQAELRRIADCDTKMQQDQLSWIDAGLTSSNPSGKPSSVRHGGARVTPEPNSKKRSTQASIDCQVAQGIVNQYHAASKTQAASSEDIDVTDFPGQRKDVTNSPSSPLPSAANLSTGMLNRKSAFHEPTTSSNGKQRPGNFYQADDSHKTPSGPSVVRKSPVKLVEQAEAKTSDQDPTKDLPMTRPAFPTRKSSLDEETTEADCAPPSASDGDSRSHSRNESNTSSLFAIPVPAVREKEDNTSLTNRLPPLHQESEEEVESEWEDDGNAWCNCVCGDAHEGEAVFWIQCDVCFSWYNVQSRCVGFDKSHIDTVKKWMCWSCEDNCDICSPTDGYTRCDDGSLKTKDGCDNPTGASMPCNSASQKSTRDEGDSDNKPHERSKSNGQDIADVDKRQLYHTPQRDETPQWLKRSDSSQSLSLVEKEEKKAKKRASSSLVPQPRSSPSSIKRQKTMKANTLSQERMPSSVANDSINSGSEKGDTEETASYDKDKVYNVGDLVFVKQHAWPGVNNDEGIAHVTAAYDDEDDDRVYDVKYVIGGKSKGVLPDYLRPFTFSNES